VRSGQRHQRSDGRIAPLGLQAPISGCRREHRRCRRHDQNRTCADISAGRLHDHPDGRRLNAVAHSLDPKYVRLAATSSNRSDPPGPNVLVSHPDAPFKTFKEFIDQCTEPNKLNCGYTHAASATWRWAAKAKPGMVGIPYKGGGPMMNDLLGGQIPIMFISQDVALGRMKAASCARYSHQLQRNPLYRYADGRERLSGLPGAVVVNHRH
jgi:hypothetical protein